MTKNAFYGLQIFALDRDLIDLDVAFVITMAKSQYCIEHSKAFVEWLNDDSPLVGKFLFPDFNGWLETQFNEAVYREVAYYIGDTPEPLYRYGRLLDKVIADHAERVVNDLAMPLPY